MNVRPSLYLAGTSLLMPLAVASAQRLEVGSYLRISHHCQSTGSSSPGDRIVCRSTRGALTRITADSVYLGALTGAVARDSIQRFELRVRRSHQLKGAGIGALVGTAVGLGVGVLVASECRRSGTGDPALCGMAYLVTGGAGLAVGTLTGVIIGGGEQWRPVTLHELGAGRPRVPKRFTLGVALAW